MIIVERRWLPLQPLGRAAGERISGPVAHTHVVHAQA